MTKILRSITVGELRELLDDFIAENGPAGAATPVVFSTDYGDHCHTDQALPLKGGTAEVRVVESAYSNSGFAVIDADGDDVDDDGDDDDVDDAPTYLLIK